MIIFGLGNPGSEYRSTRHNAGHILLDYMAKQQKKRFSTRKGYKINQVKLRGEKIRLIKPFCWMNQSGVAIAQILKTYQDKFLVIVDDINLPLGRMRLRAKGSDGGHLGLRSIINSLNSDDFPRLRIGIGQPFCDAALYVLARFDKDEQAVLKSIIEHAVKGMGIMIKEGFEKAQNYINAIDLMKKAEQ